MRCFFIVMLFGLMMSATPALSGQEKPSTTVTGAVGLNTIPSARMDEKGTVRIGIGTSDPFTHLFLGFQLTDYLHAGVRQTLRSPKIITPLEAVYPGIDLKLRLMEETRYRPAVALGFESAIGHQQMGSEYLALSKRYKDFDFTGGIAWGRLGSAGHINNPLGLFAHFDTERDFDPNGSQGIRQWFTGEQVGLFGGVEYFTPLKGLSVKADYGADDYPVARLIDGFDKPAPWSVGINYQPWHPIDVGIGIVGGDKIMARLSLQDQIKDWSVARYKPQESPRLKSPRRPFNKRNIGAGRLSLSAFEPTAYQVGQTAIKHANNMEVNQEAVALKLYHKGLKGPVITLIRSDLEKALLNNQAAPEEIWQDTTIEKNDEGFLSFKDGKKKKFLRLILQNQLSLQQIDSSPLFRNALLVESEKAMKYGFLLGSRAKLNIANNLGSLTLLRNFTPNTIRTDVDAFTYQRLTVDRLYGGWLHSINSNLHFAATGGYLEEMFRGYGGEILYRPFDKNYAIGAEAFTTTRRRPQNLFGSNNNDKDHYNTAHLNLYYEPPNTNMTFYAKAGRYLAGDTGATIGLQTIFDNGTKLEGYMTQTNQSDFNLLGSVSNAFGGIKMTVPLGNIPYIPEGSEVQLNVEPFARGSGQVLDRPLQLYEVTEPIASRSIQRSWHSLLD